VYSEAASEYGAYRGSFYHSGEGSTEYGGDELPWEWREYTRMRVQDSFEFCLTTRKSRSDSSAGVLRWSTASVVGHPYGQRSRRYRNRHHKRKSSSKGKEPLSSNEKAELDGDQDEPFEGLERVLAAVGFPTPASPSRRGILHKDLFDAPASTSEAASPHHPVIEPLQLQQTQPTPSTSMFTGLEAPKMAKRNSKDKIPGSSTGTAPLLTLPYPFSRPGAGQVSSKDSVPFPGARNSKSSGSRSGKNSKSGSSNTGSDDSGSGTGSGSAEGEEEEEEDDDDEDEEDDDEDDDDEDVIDDSEDPSSERASGSMSSLGHPISSPSRYPFGMRRPVGAGHGRSMSGVSSGMSSGPAASGGSHAHSQSMSSSYGTGAVSVLTHSTGNQESTDSEVAAEGRERASLSQGNSGVDNGNGIPMPPRHPRAHGQGRGRTSTGASSSSAAAAMAALSMHSAPVAFPTVQAMRRVDSGRGVVVHPKLLYAAMDGQHELHDDDEDEDEDEDDEDIEEVRGEREDRVGLLGVPSSPQASLHGSRVSLVNTSSSGSGHSGEARSRTHSAFSGSSRSRHSSTRARSRTRTHSSHSPSVRERANSLGASMRSLMQGASASLTQLDLVMRGATGPAAGLGGLISRPRSRVNSSMARLEEDVVFSPSATELGERNRGVSGASSGSGSGEAVSPLAGRTYLEEAEGYVSSGGTHSRSGSESVNAENYTFGRPILFMRPTVEQEHEDVEEEDEVVVMERSTGTAGRGSPSGTAAVPIPTVMRLDDHVTSDPLSSSLSTTSFYSQDASDRTASPTTPVPGPLVEHPPSAPHSADHSPTRQGIDIPWNQRGLLVPSAHRSRWGASSTQPHDGATTSSASPPDISTAAGSFVTAAATIEGNTTATDSTGQRTVPSSWGTTTAAAGPALRSGGMVERPGEDMGAGGAWRIM